MMGCGRGSFSQGPRTGDAVEYTGTGSIASTMSGSNISTTMRIRSWLSEPAFYVQELLSLVCQCSVQVCCVVFSVVLLDHI